MSDENSSQIPPNAPAQMGERILSRVGARQSYLVRLATTEEDLLAAQKLRFEVFNIELQEGLQESFDTGLDRDPFDAICDHLVVEEVLTKKVVGTYRLQTGRRAAANRGYYSAQEFDFTPLEPLRGEMVELGRGEDLLEWRCGDHLAVEGVGGKKHPVVEEDVVDPHNPFAAQSAVVQSG